MAFKSEYAKLIWDKLYRVRIPDIITLDSNYIKTRGIHITDNKDVNKMIKTNKIDVMIPIAKILEYFVDGIEIEIISREDMIQMHKDIELYLDEWKNHLKYDINLNKNEYKELLISLEKLSKTIYERARSTEIVGGFTILNNFGMRNSLVKLEEEKNVNKPDYSGISEFFTTKKSRF